MPLNCAYDCRRLYFRTRVAREQGTSGRGGFIGNSQTAPTRSSDQEVFLLGLAALGSGDHPERHATTTCPGILGILMFTRLIPKYGWISRYAIACYLGSAGLAVPLFLRTHVVRQIHASMLPFGIDKATGEFSVIALINSVIIFVGVICGLTYFFFSKPHKGFIGGMANIGICVLMVGFGAAFGYTVMSRISLLIGRLQFLIFDAIVPFFNYLSG